MENCTKAAQSERGGRILTAEIPLSKGYVATVDLADFERLFSWNWHAQVGSSPYARRTVRVKHANGRTKQIVVPMASQILGIPVGSAYIADHINGNTLDNRRVNLRRATWAENTRNRKTISTNTSGISGVCWRDDEQKWMAYIHVGSRQMPLGRFADYEDAVRVRKEAEEEHFGEFARREIA